MAQHCQVNVGYIRSGDMRFATHALLKSQAIPFCCLDGGNS